MSDVVEIRHRPQGPVLKAYGESIAPVHIIRGPLGGGKTYESIYKMLDLCINQKATKQGERKTRGAVIRNTYPDLVSTVLKDVREVIPENIGRMTMGHPQELDLDFDLEDGTRVIANIIFLALDKPEDQRKVRGLNVTWIYVNEVKELARAVFDMLTTRADRYPQIGWSTWAGVFGDTNAWDQDHWLEDLAEKSRKGEIVGYEFFTQPGGVVKVNGKWEVNPLAENPATTRRVNGKPSYYDNALQGKREEWIRVNLANEIGYSFDGKPVHPLYSDTINVAHQPLIPQAGIVVWVGLDFGLMPAAVFWQRQNNGQWWGLDEIAEPNVPATQFIPMLKAKCAQWNALVPSLRFVFKGDPSGDNRSGADGRTTMQIYRLAGIPVSACSTNDVQPRRDALDRVLMRTIPGQLPALLLSPHMKMLRKALAGGWQYKRVQIGGTEKYRDEADKNEFSHVGDAAEYGLIDAGENSTIGGGTGFAAPPEWPTGGKAITPQRGPSRIFDPVGGVFFNEP